MNALNGSDLALMGQEAPAVSSIKKIRDHHHYLAMLVAQGKRTGEIAEMTGMSLSRISILKGDPAFQELVEAYRKRVNDAMFDVVRQIETLRRGNEIMALEIMRERLEDQSELIGIRELIDIHAEMADRNGRSKVSRSESISMKGDLADGLAEARRRELLLSAQAAPPEQEPDAERSGPDHRQPAVNPAPTGGDT